MNDVIESFTIVVSTKTISNVFAFSTAENIRKTKAFFENEVDNFFENFKTFDKPIKDFMINVSKAKNFNEPPFNVFGTQLKKDIEKVPEEKGIHYALYLHIQNQIAKKNVAMTTGFTVGYNNPDYEETMKIIEKRLRKYNADEPLIKLKYDLER
jgi:hypothetical protein